jgi:hypothetical protein
MPASLGAATRRVRRLLHTFRQPFVALSLARQASVGPIHFVQSNPKFAVLAGHELRALRLLGHLDTFRLLLLRAHFELFHALLGLLGTLVGQLHSFAQRCNILTIAFNLCLPSANAF